MVDEENRNVLEDKESRKSRDLAARANYSVQDRCDIQFAVKYIYRGMCSLTKGDVRKLRRLPRYVIKLPRTVSSPCGRLSRTISTVYQIRASQGVDAQPSPQVA